MPTNHRRPPFMPGHVYQASKCVTINGVEMQPGQKLTAEQIADVGERRLSKIYDAKLIDFATDDLPHHYTVPGALKIGEVLPPVAAVFIDGVPLPMVETESGSTILFAPDTPAPEGEGTDGFAPPAADVAPPAPASDAAAPQAPAEPEKAPVPVSGAHTAVHKGFGKWWIVDGVGEKVSGPHTQKQAKGLIDAAKVAGV